MVTPDNASTALDSARRWIRRKKWLAAILIVALFFLIAIGIWLQRGLASAIHEMKMHRFSNARIAAERYLRIAPFSVEARMLAGDAYFLDDSLDPVEAAQNAIQHYAKIPDSDPLGASSRAKEGRAAFLVLQEPSRAIRLFQRSIELNPEQFDSHYMLWQLYNMTERFHACETVFREAFRLCPPAERPHRLREWYLSQFSPLSACSQLDLMMGFRDAPELPSEEVAFRRLSAFLEYEPNEPDTIAALAQWHLRNQSRDAALLELEKIEYSAAAAKSPFYAATFVETLIELGQTERARQVFGQLKGQTDSYQYFRIAGIHAQEVEGDLEKAVNMLRNAVNTWPGPSDWLLMNRLSRCLALQGLKAESQQVAANAKRIEALTDISVHNKIKQVLGRLDATQGLLEVVEFYEEFDRHWEVAAWREIIANSNK